MKRSNRRPSCIAHLRAVVVHARHDNIALAKHNLNKAVARCEGAGCPLRASCAVSRLASGQAYDLAA